jgi:hypothetical protein
MIEMHIPENVKLWESPGRAGGLPNCNYFFWRLTKDGFNGI